MANHSIRPVIVETPVKRNSIICGHMLALGNPALFVAVPNVAAAWWSSRDLRLPRSNSVLRPLSPESPHETNFPKPQTSIRLSARFALVCLAPENNSCP